MSDGLEVQIMMDIADWQARHHLALPEAAIADAVQRIAALHAEHNADRQRLSDVMRTGDLEHNRNVALLERCERAEAVIEDLRVGAEQQSQSNADVLTKIADYERGTQ